MNRIEKADLPSMDQAMRWLIRQKDGFHIACISMMGETYKHLMEEHGVFEKDLLGSAANNILIHIDQHHDHQD